MEIALILLGISVLILGITVIFAMRIVIHIKELEVSQIKKRYQLAPPEYKMWPQRIELRSAPIVLHMDEIKSYRNVNDVVDRIKKGIAREMAETIAKQDAIVFDVNRGVHPWEAEIRAYTLAIPPIDNSRRSSSYDREIDHIKSLFESKRYPRAEKESCF